MPGIPSLRLEDENRTCLFDLSLVQVLGKIKPGGVENGHGFKALSGQNW